MWNIPEIIDLHSDNLKYKKGFLFWIQEDGVTNLYRIELQEGDLVYVKFTNYPTLTYKNPEKIKHMLRFLEEKNICYKSENENIIIYDDSFNEHTMVKAPLYIRENEQSCYLKERKYAFEFPTKETIDASYKVFEKVYKKIRQEEIIYDFFKLSMYEGICAYMEDYPLPLSYLDKNIFYVVDIDVNPNTRDEPYNEYTNTYMEKSIHKAQNKVVFNRSVIAKHITEDGKIYCLLPKEIASVVIGKEGCIKKWEFAKISIQDFLRKRSYRQTWGTLYKNERIEPENRAARNWGSYP